jgi:hypothetical protein
MNFDVNKTISLVKGCLLDQETTWNSYLGENPGWQQTAITLTGPMILANVILSTIFGRMTGGFAGMGMHSNFLVALILGLIFTALGFLVAVLAFNFLAGVFEGKVNFPRAFAAVSMAAVPAWLAGIAGSLIPWVGMLVALAGGIWSLILLYRIIPRTLNVPDSKRVLHFVISLVAIIIVNMIVGSILGLGTMRGGFSGGGYTSTDSSGAPVASGMFGELERQGRLMDAAAADVYEPPDDGMLTEDQVEDYISVMKKARVAQENYAKEIQALSQEMDKKQDEGETPSVADISKVYRGVGTAMGANNAEMEIVKTGDGNWAEHQWVKEQLRVARLQLGEGSDELEHNYALYQEYEEELQALD